MVLEGFSNLNNSLRSGGYRWHLMASVMLYPAFSNYLAPPEGDRATDHRAGSWQSLGSNDYEPIAFIFRKFKGDTGIPGFQRGRFILSEKIRSKNVNRKNINKL